MAKSRWMLICLVAVSLAVLASGCPKPNATTMEGPTSPSPEMKAQMAEKMGAKTAEGGAAENAATENAVPETAPAGEADVKALAEAKCGKCHPYSQCIEETRTPEDWQKIVGIMAKKKAGWISSEEETKIAEYLAKEYAKK